MPVITVRCGINSVTRDVPEGTTVRDLRTNSTIKAGAGYGDNVEFLTEGDVLSDDTRLVDDQTVVVQPRANTKAR